MGTVWFMENNIIDIAEHSCQCQNMSEMSTPVLPVPIPRQRGEAKPASKTATPLPIAIVGLGFGRWVVRALEKPEKKQLFDIAALCDLNAPLALKMAAEIGCGTASFEEILADPEIPVVGIFTGPAGRADMVRQAIRAGKHVMTTKPFERDSAAARDVLEEAARLGRLVHINSPTPELPPDLAQIQKWKKTHSLGAPLAAHFSCYARYEEDADGRWHDESRLCPAAPIFRLGIYLINDAIRIFGEPEEVYVMTSRLFTKRPTPDHAQLSIRFQSGALATIFASFCVEDGDSYRNELTLHFERGTIYRNAGPEGRSGRRPRLALVQKDNDGPKIVEDELLSSVSGEYDWAAFHRSIVQGEPAPPDYPSIVAAGIRVVEAMAESEITGQPVKVLPDRA
jgi:predicted dehydrogenase